MCNCIPMVSTPWRILVALGLCCALLLRVNGDEPIKPTAVPHREIHVPFEDLPSILTGGNQRVFMTREEYDALLAKSTIKPTVAPPQFTTLLSSQYGIQIENGLAMIDAAIELEALQNGLQSIELHLQGAGVLEASLDGKPAFLVKRTADPAEPIRLLLEGLGVHQLKLKLISPMQTAAAQQTLAVSLPRTPSSRWTMQVPGNVEIRSGIAVRSRSVDTQSNVTKFELVPGLGAGASNSLNVIMSLNNKLLRESRSMVCRSVIVDEVASAYEQLHATFTMNVLYGAVDRFRFEIPRDFEITQVRSPLLARWIMVAEGERRILEVGMRETIADNAIIDIVGSRQNGHGITTSAQPWSWPTVTPLDVDNHTSILSAWLENGIQARKISDSKLIALDHSQLQAKLPNSFLTDTSGRPAMRPFATYFAPAAEQSFTAELIKPIKLPSTKSTLIAAIGETELSLAGLTEIRAFSENVSSLEMIFPNGWAIQQASLIDGTPLTFEVMNASDRAEHDAHRIRILLPTPIKPNASQTMRFAAVHTPKGWLDGWQSQSVPFPNLHVLNTDEIETVIAAASTDDMDIQPDVMTSLTPIFESERTEHQLQSLSGLAFRSLANEWTLVLKATRNQPRVTAQVYSFLRIAPEGLFANYELKYDVSQAKTGRVTFSLPESTPSEIAIQGVQGTRVKETSSTIRDGRRIWSVELVQKASGTLRITAGFQTKIPQDGTQQILPMVRALDVSYQTGMASIEGDDELEIEVMKHPRPVDVGELTDAQYVIGNRLLGTFGYSTGASTEDTDGAPSEGSQKNSVVVSIANRSLRPLPTTLVERAELLSILSSQGKSHHVANFALKTTGGYIRADLPPNAKLWSMLLDGEPTLPQRDGDRLVVDLAERGRASSLAGQAMAQPPPGYSQSMVQTPNSNPTPLGTTLRKLTLIYEMPIPTLGFKSRVAFVAPRLLTVGRAVDGAASTNRETDTEVPIADLEWNLCVPNDLQVAQSHGTVSPMVPLTSEDFLSHLGAHFMQLGGGINRYALFDAIAARQAARSSARSFQAPASSAARTTGDANLDELALSPEVSTNLVVPFANDLVTDAKQDSSPRTPTEDRSRIAGRGSIGPRKPPEKNAISRSLPATLPMQRWMANLEGLRTLNIDVPIPTTGASTVFHGYGTDSQMNVSIVNVTRLEWLGLAMACLSIVVWLLATRNSIRRSLLALAPTLLGIVLVGYVVPWDFESFILCGWMMAGLLLTTSGQVIAWVWIRFAKRWGHVLGSLLLAASLGILSGPSAIGQTQVEPPIVVKGLSELVPLLRHWEGPAPHIEIPADAIVVPYNPNNGGIKSSRASEKLLVPYETYQRLWNLANPDRKRIEVAPPSEYSLSNLVYRTTLDRDDSLVIDGSMQIELHVHREILIPFGFSNGVFTRAEVDNEPAKLKAVDQTIVLSTNHFGIQTFDFSLRIPIQRQGGWRVVQAVLPSAPAAKVSISVPNAKTELRISSLGDRTERETSADHDSMEVPLASQGQFGLQWRPKVTDTAVDQGLSAQSDCVLDIQEDGLRVAWSFQMEFRRARRDQFEFQLPSNVKVEKVLGNNIRGWTVRNENDLQRLNVTLLKTALEREQLTIVASQFQRVGTEENATLAAPSCSIPEAMLHQGSILLRRSAWLDLVVTQSKGLTRMDLPNPIQELAPIDDARPIALKPFQAYRFSSRDYELGFRSTPMPSKVTSASQSILRLTASRSQLESRIVLQVEDRPIHTATIDLPSDWKVTDCTAEQPMDYAVWDSENRQRIQIRFASGQMGNIPIVVTAIHTGSTLPDSTEQRVPSEFSESLPRIEIRDVIRQHGDIVIQADVGLDIRAEQLVDCKVSGIGAAANWLRPEQQALARSMIHFDSPTYNGLIKAIPKSPMVSCLTVSNIKLTQRALEETIFLEWTIRDAGIRRLEFTLPARWRDALVQSQMTRRLTREPISDKENASIRFAIELQDYVIGQYRVVLQQDSELPKGIVSATIPTALTGSVENRLITIENSGRDELVVDRLHGMTAIVRGQSQWSKLASLLGGQAAEAYRVNDRENQMASVQPFVINTKVAEEIDAPSLTYQTKDRSVVETASARIGLAKTTISVDESGAYRAIQEYRVENTKEPFLELELPDGAQLWATVVADAPVKPIQPSGPTGKSVRVRLPLVRTQVGDLDYGVMIKYAGSLGKSGSLSSMTFPLIKTINVNVELSQVRLMLPENQHWYGFSGTLGRVGDEGDFLAGELSYKNKLLQNFSDVLSKTSAGSFSNVRAATNAKRVQGSIQADFLGGTTQSFAMNDSLREQIELNSSVASKVQSQTAMSDQASMQEATVDNREVFNRFYAEQSNGRSGGQVSIAQGLSGNFNADSKIASMPRSKLDATANVPQLMPADKPEEAVTKNLQAYQLRSAKSKDASKGSSDDLRQQAMRYRGRLEEQQGQVVLNGAMLNSINAAPSQPANLDRSRFGGSVNADGEPMAGGLGGKGGVVGPGGGPAPGFGYGGPGGPAGYGGGSAIPSTLPADAWMDGRNEGVAPLFAPTPNVGPSTAGYLASLDIELPKRGQVFLFSTPRGQLELTAKGISKELVTRLYRVAGALTVTLILGMVVLVIRRIGLERILVMTRYAMLSLGFISLVTSVLPYYGLLLLAVAALWSLGSIPRDQESLSPKTT